MPPGNDCIDWVAVFELFVFFDLTLYLPVSYTAYSLHADRNGDEP